MGPWTKHRVLPVLLLAGLALQATGCLFFGKEDGAVTAVGLYDDFDGCAGLEQFRVTILPVLTAQCIVCHYSESDYILNEDLLHDYASTLHMLKEDDDGNPEKNPLLIKSSGGDGHSGGQVLSKLSGDYENFVYWVAAERDVPCDAAVPYDAD